MIPAQPLTCALPVSLPAMHQFSSSFKEPRGLVDSDSLSDFIVTGLSSVAAAGEIFLVSYCEDFSTTEPVCRLWRAVSEQ